MAEKKVYLKIDENNLNFTSVPSRGEYSDKDSLLMHSVYQGAMPCVEYLLGDGASINLSHDNGLTPLHLSIVKGHLDVFNLLISNGASLNKISRGDILPAYTAAEYDRLEMLSEILKRNPEQVKTLDAFKSTLLHVAAAKGSVECVKLLLELDCEVNAQNIFGDTSLHCAVQREQQEVIEWLLGNGADPNVANGQGFCPLHVAAVIGNGRIVELLIVGGSDVEPVSNDNATPLFLAYHTKKTNVVNILRRRNAKKSCKCFDGCSHDPNILFKFVENNNLEKIKELIKSGVILDIGDDRGCTPLLVAACTHRNFEAANLFIEAGSNVETQDWLGFQVVHFAAKYNEIKTLKKLKEKGADLNAATSAGHTPLTISINENNFDSVKTLIELGADINKAGSYNQGPLQQAVFDNFKNDNIDLVKFLIENGAEVNSEDYSGRTPLYEATVGGSLEIIEILLQHNAVISIEDYQYGQIPIEFIRDNVEPCYRAKIEAIYKKYENKS